MAKITKRSAGAAQARDGGERVLWDDQLRGFGLRVQASGAKSWVLKYRHDGRQRKLTLGSFPSLTPEVARQLARKRLGEIANGRDPAAERAEKRRARTVAELAERFLAEHVEAHCKSSQQRNARAHLERLVFPVLGAVKVRSVTREDVKRLHRKHRKTPVLANRMLTTLSRLFTWAEEVGALPEGSPNPVRGVKRYREKARDTYLGDAEIAMLGKTLREAERTKSERWQPIGAIRLLLLTGCRLNEILRLEWGDVDLGDRMLHLRDTKTGDRTLPLNAPAAQVLSELPREDGARWVFPGGRSSDGPWTNLWSAWGRIRRDAGIDERVHLHDLRHTHGSVGAASGLSLVAVGALLGHKVPATTQRYAHFGRDPRRQASEQVGARIAAAMGEGEGAEVVPLRPAGR
jgi:integrase